MAGNPIETGKDSVMRVGSARLPGGQEAVVLLAGSPDAAAREVRKVAEERGLSEPIQVYGFPQQRGGVIGGTSIGYTGRIMPGTVLPESPVQGGYVPPPLRIVDGQK